MRLTVVNLTSGGLSGGYEKYLGAVLPRMARSPLVSALSVVSPSTVALAPIEGVNYGSWVPRRLGSRDALKRAVRETSPDVVFVPTARWVDFGVPTVTMVRNMEPLVRPLRDNPPAEGAKNLLRRAAAHRACRRATRVLAVSEFVRDFLVKHWSVPAGRIGVVYHGTRTRHAWQGPPPARTAAIVGEPFVLTVGSVRPARGLEDILDAFVDLPDHYRLVVAGAPTPDSQAYADALRLKAEAIGGGGRVHWLGHVTQDELAWWYSNSAALVMTTRVEACPNVALEALAFGCLSVAASNPPLPEILGSAAVYYEPGNVKSLACVLLAHLAGGEVTAAKGLRAAALDRAARFDWDVTVERTLAEIRRLM